MDPADLARAYYAAVDDDDYDRLRTLLAPEFVHDRPDRTLSGRERFVRFVREERPVRETTHEVTAVYEGPAGVAVRGRLLAPAGGTLLEFVDLFAVDPAPSTTDADAASADADADADVDPRIARLETFVRA
jgi:ketosteroid isomerase-like protein